MVFVTRLSRDITTKPRLVVWLTLVLVLGLALTLVLRFSGILENNGDAHVHYQGFMPNWTLAEMVDRSDAIIIGTISRELSVKEIPIGSDDGRTLASIVADYEVQVERTLHPSKGDFPSTIAVSTTGGKRLGTFVALSDDHPTYQKGERMLLFLERLPDRTYIEIPGFNIPQGFTQETYFNHLVSAKYGKLILIGEEWKDSRTGETLSVPAIEAAVYQAETKGP